MTIKLDKRGAKRKTYTKRSTKLHPKNSSKNDQESEASFTQGKKAPVVRQFGPNPRWDLASLNKNSICLLSPVNSK